MDMAIAAPLPESEGPIADLEGFSHAYADVNGVRIHYVVGGTGPTVVLVHGFPFTWAAWRKVMPLLAVAGFTVIAPDLRGIGGSSRTEEGFTKANVAKDIHDIVEHLHAGPIGLVGMDIGTMVAIAYAARYPEGVRRLVLSESLLPGFGLEELMNPATGGFWHFGFHMQVDVAEMLTAGKEAAYMLPWYKMMSASADAEDVARSTFLPHYVAPGGMRAGFQHYATLVEDGKANRAALSSKLKMPVLVLNGARSIPQAPLLAGVRQVAETVETDIVPESSHTMAHDNPRWLADRLVRFFQ